MNGGREKTAVGTEGKTLRMKGKMIDRRKKTKGGGENWSKNKKGKKKGKEKKEEKKKKRKKPL